MKKALRCFYAALYLKRTLPSCKLSSLHVVFSPLKSLLVAARRAAQLALEHRMHVLARGEAAAQRDVRQVAIALLQDAGGGVQARAQDLVVHAAPQLLPEVALQRRARNADIVRHLLGADALAGVLADEVACA